MASKISLSLCSILVQDKKNLSIALFRWHWQLLWQSLQWNHPVTQVPQFSVKVYHFIGQVISNHPNHLRARCFQHSLPRPRLQDACFGLDSFPCWCWCTQFSDHLHSGPNKKVGGGGRWGGGWSQQHCRQQRLQWRRIIHGHLNQLYCSSCIITVSLHSRIFIWNLKLYIIHVWSCRPVVNWYNFEGKRKFQWKCLFFFLRHIHIYVWKTPVW